MQPLLIVVYGLIIVATFAVMEFVAWALHKYVMHGFGWVLHEDHHRPPTGKFQKNDAYALVFSLLAFFLIFFGARAGFDARFYAGVGVTAYGVGYFLFHDIFYHRRIKIKWQPKNRYYKRIVRAHSTHHQQSSAHEGVAFGFLYAQRKYAPEVTD